MCWCAHEEPFIPYEIMVEIMVGSTFSASNVHGVETNKSNPYKTMVMDAMGMNQSHTS